MRFFEFIYKPIVIFVLLVISFVLLLIFVPKLEQFYFAVSENKATIERLDQDINAYIEKNRSLSARVAFMSGKFGLEKIARENYNMKKEGELVFSIEAGTDTFVSVGTSVASDQVTSSDNYISEWYQYFFE